MYTPALLSALLATTALATPITKRDSGPSINVIFFSDNNCTTTVPPTIYTRTVYGDHGCYSFPSDSYSSLLIDEIDDQFIGTNTALQVGSAADGDACDFGSAIKFSVATRDSVGQCQFVGIPGGQGKPLRGGNEYRLTSLEG
ncbi:hypothetical protein BT63DRAFT_425512 [Microthyrium microscopicum]|uniref:AA1-like domain-containing protein n=1 Tax=Microthyrium microscopicum TaxID=703497 RepID=A0A6A6UA54_9PEZI|nr:hypothetical protein BT63DRAFT_425512 [Microthyrium microscopicum]